MRLCRPSRLGPGSAPAAVAALAVAAVLLLLLPLRPGPGAGAALLAPGRLPATTHSATISSVAARQGFSLRGVVPIYPPPLPRPRGPTTALPPAGVAPPPASGATTAGVLTAAALLGAVVGQLVSRGRPTSAAIPSAPACGDLSRRAWLGAGLAGTTAAALPPPAAQAALLTRFPPQRLRNVYLLMRSGEGKFEATGMVRTNPLSVTSVNGGLTFEGRRQAILGMNAIKALRLDTDMVWIWPSVTSRSLETAEILGQGLGISRTRIVPEYAFLAARAFGAYEGKPQAQLEEVYQADQIDTSIRPPPSSDGTPNESLNDVVTRSIQLLSKLETLYLGNIVVLVSPDSDNLSVLQALLTGYDMRKNHDLAYQPGEVRMVNLTGLDPPLEEEEAAAAVASARG